MTTQRKKLSEIGHKVYIEAQPPACRLHVHTEFSPDELRELVKSAAIGFWEKTGDLDYADELSIKFAEFLKDEGL